MPSRRRTALTLLLTVLALAATSGPVLAQEAPQPVVLRGPEELLGEALKDLEALKTGECGDHLRLWAARKAERYLKRILWKYPDTPLRGRVEGVLVEARAAVAEEMFQKARSYLDRTAPHYSTQEGEKFLLALTREFPNSPRGDEALFMLGELSLKGGRERDAANYFWKLVCQFPTSTRAARAFGHLGRIGMDASKGCDNPRPE